MLESSSPSPKHLEHPLIWPNTVELRLYQKKIADVASQKNTLVILPTSLGKTVISAIVAAKILYDYKDAKVLVMAPTRPLVIQHRNSFMRLLRLRERDTTILTGKTPPEYRRTIWEGDAKLIFSTPQVVRNDLLKHRLSLEKYSLLVFDECHRAVKEYAYRDIAEFYVSQNVYPLILGMTASPGSNLDRVLEVCRNLRIERIEYRSEEDQDVKPYIQPINIMWRRVDLPREYLEIRSQIWSMLNRRLNWLSSTGLLKRRPEYMTKKGLIEVGNELRYMLEDSIEEEKGKFFTAIINQSLALTLFHMVELLETQGLWTLMAFLDKVTREKGDKRSYEILINDPDYRKLRNLIDIHPTEHPKLVLMKNIVEEQLNRRPSSRMLIFAQYRDTTSHLVSELNTLANVRADRFVGQASKLMDKGLTQEEQTKRIKQLEEGELNVLVATSIAEEGLDIPAVDHVIFYEPIPSEIRYIQRRGRTGRKSPGKATILATNDSLDMIYLYASQRKTKRMKEITESVRSKLQTVLRTQPKPPPNPLTLQELRTLETETKQVKVQPETIKTESEKLKRVSKKVGNTSKILYMKLLERGASGADFEELASFMKFKESSITILKGAVEKLMREGFITETKSGRYATTSAAKSVGKTYKITIEKIVPGSAEVIVNDKWKAKLMPDDYNGPRSLIKKSSKFRAIVQLYRLGRNLQVRVKAVTEILQS